MYILFLFVALVVLLLLLKYSGYVTGGLTTQKTNYLHDLSLVDGDESSSKWVVSSKPSWVAHSKYRKVVSNSTNLRNNYKTDFKVLVTTWNVGDTAPNYEQFASLSQDVYDFVVIGTQVCKSISKCLQRPGMCFCCSKRPFGCGIGLVQRFANKLTEMF